MPKMFNELFPRKKTIIGMVHLSGDSPQEKIDRALEEINLYALHCLDGVIIEDYHGNEEDLYNVLEATRDVSARIVKGINFLRNPYNGFEIATEFGAKFVQLDALPQSEQDIRRYNLIRKENFPGKIVFGGVRFKYQKPTGKTLETEIKEAMSLCNAIVTTGDATGVETPIEKLREFRRAIMNLQQSQDYSEIKPYPLIVGAGVTADNVSQQLAIADGAIIGSYFKFNGDTRNRVDRVKVARLMDRVREIR